MVAWGWIVAALFVGTFLGFMVAALMAASQDPKGGRIVKVSVDGFDEYEADTERTGSDITLEQGAMKIAEEAGEVVAIVSKGLYQGHPIDKRKLREELGDLLFYVVRTGRAYGIPFSDIAAGNVGKRLLRYPNGFSAADSIARRDEAHK